MSFLVLGLLGTTLVGAVAFDWFDGQDDAQNGETTPEESDLAPPDPIDDTPPQVTDDIPPDDTGRALSFDGSDVLEGTEEDDAFYAGQDDSLEPEVINLLGGNDKAFVEVYDYITVNGGDGADVITATGVTNTIEGDAGNDTLIGDDSNALYGGAGDDVLEFNHGFYDQGEWGLAHGGEGNDTITVRTDALVPEYITGDVGGVQVSGGPGADDINIIYDFTETFDGVERPVTLDTTTTFEGDFISITEYDPSEDTLVVELERDEAMAETEVTVEMDQTEEDGTYTSLITLTFEATELTSVATNVLTVYSAVPFTLDDIQLVGI